MVFFKKNWVNISIFNLTIVVLLGVIMRYKIAFNFPFLEQKNILHSHSHFAFTGWISQTLFLLITYFIERNKKEVSSLKYHYFLLANLGCSYGMLVSFLLEGYSGISVFFSTLSILISFIYTYYFIKDTKKIPKGEVSIIWFKGALFFNILSSLGTFFLAYMIANKAIVQDLYLSSIYFYLHFQYNGWFFFAIIGLFLEFIKVTSENKKLKIYFWILFVSCFITFFLSILWAKLPSWLYITTVTFTLIQTFYWFKFQSYLLNQFRDKVLLYKNLIIVIAIATNLKFLMQLGLIFPELNTIVFGTRIIVIAYLHLVLLGIITLFLLFYLINIKKIFPSKFLKIGYLTFVIGIIINEAVLFCQGAFSFLYILFPFVNELLFTIGIIMLIGILIILYAVVFKNEKK